MALSRRNFLTRGLATAIACASAPLAELGFSRELPRYTKQLGRNGGSATGIPGIHSHEPHTPEQRNARLAGINRDSFRAAIGSAFKVSDTSGKVSPFWLRLLSVEDFDAAPAVDPASMAVAPRAAVSQAIHTTTFSLRFSGGPVETLQQETFVIEHDQLGEFSLFIVPAGPQQYTAIINRLPVMTAIPV
jgi:hypothetical protein